MGVVIRRYRDILIIITYPYSTCITSFLQQRDPTSLFILKMFFRSLYICIQLTLFPLKKELLRWDSKP